MRNRAFLKVALLGLLAFALAPGYAAAAGQGQNLSEMLASNAAAHATAVSGPVISASPLAFSFGDVNNGSTSPAQQLTITNIGDADLHVTAINSSDPAFSTNFAPATIAPFGGFAVFNATFSPLDGNAHSGSLTIMSDASNGNPSLAATGQGNNAPTLDPIGNKSVVAFTTLAFTVTASDNADTRDDDAALSMGPGLPPSATFNTGTGEFSWTPDGSEAGTYSVTFSASDGLLSDSEEISITVTTTNNPPTADAGGTYFGATNQPLQFNGSGSSDPDAGQTLSFSWAFGDGGTATGATPQHTYAIEGNFIASLQVCDDGSPQLCDSDVAPVTIQTEVVAQVILKNNSSTLRAKGGGRQQIAIEESEQPYTNVILSSLRLTHDGPAGAVSECAPELKGARITDLDLDGVADFAANYANSCLNQLFSNTPNNSLVDITISGLIQVPGGTLPLRGVKSDVTVRTSGGGAVSSFASPNPFNPETSIALTLRNNGPVTMRIYSIDGRLVRTLMNGQHTPSGTHEVRWNGIDDQGRHVPSGVYFVKTSQRSGGTEEASVIKLAVTK